MRWIFSVIFFRLYSYFQRFLVASWVEWLAFQNNFHLCVSDTLSLFCSFLAWWCFSRFGFSFFFWIYLLQEGAHAERLLFCLTSFRSPISSLTSFVVCASGHWHLFLLCLTALVFLALGNVVLYFIFCLLGDMCFSFCRHVGLLTVASRLGRIFTFRRTLESLPSRWRKLLVLDGGWRWSPTVWFIAMSLLFFWGLTAYIWGEVSSSVASSQREITWISAYRSLCKSSTPGFGSLSTGPWLSLDSPTAVWTNFCKLGGLSGLHPLFSERAQLPTISLRRKGSFWNATPGRVPLSGFAIY